MAMTFLAVGTLASLAAATGVSAAATTGPHSDHVRSARDARAAKPKLQLGIDVDYYFNPATNIAATDAATVSYVKSLHANAISVSFPFYVSGRHSDTVYATAATPSAAALGQLAGAAEHAHLYFSIRPLMDQADGSRVSFTPANPKAWFASYEQFLKPYATMAQKEHVQELIEGAELTAMNSDAKYWTQLTAYLHKLYRGTLAYANNYSTHPIRTAVSSDHVVQLMDDYHPVNAPSTASVATLTRGWDAYLEAQARGITISEAGIAAKDGAYRKPYDAAGPGAFNPQIQVRWFAAACNAITNEHLGGIYFWSLVYGAPLNVPPTAAHPMDFADGPGAKEISSCFKKLG